MATKDLTILYYDDTDATLTNHQWRKLTNRIDDPDYDDTSAISTSNLPFMYGGGSPLLTCTINDRFGVQLEAELTLNNSGARHSKDFTGSTALGKLPLANGQINQFNGLLPEFTRIIIHESDSYMTLFVGRVYVMEEKFEWPYGNVLRLLCRDNLEEIAQGTLGGSDVIELEVGSNGVGNYPASISRQLDIIKEIIAKTSYGGYTSAQEIVYTDHKIDKGHTYLQGFVDNDVSEDRGVVKLGDYGNTSPLKLIQNLANLEKYRIGSVDHLGYGFCLDATRTDPFYKNYGDGISGTGILPQDFLYFRKGYYPTASPATHGLKVVYASADSVVENPGGSNDDRQRNMFNDFNFAGFADSSVTHLVLTHQNKKEIHTDSSIEQTATHDGTLDKISTYNDPAKQYYWGETDDRTCGVYEDKWLDERQTTFVMIYVDPLDGYDTIGDFSWKVGRPGYTGAKKHFHVRSLRQVSSLHTGGDQGAAPGVAKFKDGSNKTWIGNVQFQGVDDTGQNFLILSNPQEDELATVVEGAILSESSSISPRSSCKFKSFPAQTRRAKRTLFKNLKDYTTNTYSGLREAIAHEFLGGNNKDVDRLRKGFFRITDWPHMRWTNTAGSGTSGFALKPYVGNDTPSDYGMRRGASVTNITGGIKYAGYISAINDVAKTTTIELYKELELDNASPTAYGWSQGDTYNIYVPLRTGMSFRIDNKHALTIGDQIITSINYTWSNGHVSSEITSIGANDEVLFQERGALKVDDSPSVNTSMEAENKKIEGLAANAYEARGIMWWHSHDIGATPALVAASLRDYNSFAWSGGSIHIHSVNETYRITPGNTDAALTAAAYTSPMEANVQYVIYLDTSEIDKNAAGNHDLKIAQVTHTDDGYMRAPTYVEIAYLTIGENEDAGEKTIGVPGSSFYSVTIPFPNGMPNIQFMNTFSNVLGVDNQLVQANRILQPNSLTSALLKKGAGRPWASNLRIQGTAYNAISWDNGSASTDATLTFGNGDTVTITDGTRTGIGDNTTTYMYLDGTSAGLTGSLAPQFTTNHAIAHGDNKLLMAVIAVGVSTQGDKPNILPFNSKQMTINGGVIAADAVIASHVQAGTIDTTKFTTSTATSISEKARNHVGSSAPGSPRTMDIWFDTSATPTVIKVWDGDSWEVRNSNAPEGGGATIFKTANVSSPPTSNAVNDLWYVTDTDSIYVAVTHPANSIETSTEWVIQDVALAINSATTEIKGGLINTQMIILQEGGGSNDNLFITGGESFSPASNQSYIKMDHTALKGINRSGTTDTTQFEISAVDGKGKFGGGVGIISSAGLLIDQTVAGDNNGRIIIKSSAGEHGIAVIRSDNGYPAGTLLFGTGIAHKQISFNMSTAGSNDPRILFGTEMYNTTIGKDGSSNTTSYSGIRGLYFTSRTGDGNLPEAPVANGTGVLYTKADGKLYFRARTNAGSLLSETEIGSGGSTDDGIFEIRSDSGSGADYSVNTHSNSNPTIQILGGTDIGVTNSGAVFTVAFTGSSGGAALSGTNTWTGKQTFDFNGGIYLNDNGQGNADAPTGFGQIYAFTPYNDDMNLQFKDDEGNDATYLTNASGGGGGGASLSVANTWTATQTFNPSSGISVIARDTMQMDEGSWIKSMSAPGGSSGYVRLYAKGSGTASSLYFKDGGGNEFDLSSGAGGGTHPDPHRLGNGSIGAPTYSFSGKTDSGMFYDTTNTGPAIGHDDVLKQTWSANASIVSTNLWPNSSASSRYLGKTTQYWARLYAGVSTWVNSDAENKENLTPISNGLEFISRLSPITFNRKDESDIYFGFTAQEMKQAVLDSGYSEKLEVYSEELDTETGETHWGIAYETLVAPLVAAIKELKARIEVLEGD